MKGSVIQTLGYKGVVTVRREATETSISFNSGTTKLFEIIEQALAGQTITPFIPSYILGVYIPAGGENEVTFFKQNLPITARTFVPATSLGTNHCVRFSCVVRNGDTIYTLPNGAAVKLYLISNDKQTLATVTLTTETSTIFNLTTPEQRVIIDWEMSVDNS